MRRPARPEEDTVTLEGRAALITGGARMGVAVAEALATLGADVALVYRASADAAERAAAAVRARGRRAHTCVPTSRIRSIAAPPSARSPPPSAASMWS
jgi:NAD(P)-dependent dehydrogenase (short-subunit alcohol dehydrogenase family)